MRACLLGSGGWIPTGTRETTSLLVRSGARALVVDLGTGARRLVTDPALLDGAERLDVLLTHFHPDHVCGLAYLPALPLRATVWAPGTWLYGTPSADLLAGFFVPPASPFSPEGMPDVEELAGGRQKIGGWEVTARAQPLHNAATAGFRIGDTLAFVTDTAFDEGSAELARGVDHLLHEAWSTDPADPTEGHSSGLDAARVAATGVVSRLTLMHLSPFLDSHDAILAEARRAFPATGLGEDCVELLGAGG